MKTNAAGRAVIKEFEGIRLTAYRDTGGVWTIGYGHTRGVKPGLRITGQEAERLFEEDLAAAEFVVRRLVTRQLNDNQFSALVSFAYNVPFKEFRLSQLLKFVNLGDFEGAGKEFHRWVYDDGKKLPGLVRRRLVEVNLFFTPDGSAPAL
jgi:lysozyme